MTCVGAGVYEAMLLKEAVRTGELNTIMGWTEGRSSGGVFNGKAARKAQ